MSYYHGTATPHREHTHANPSLDARMAPNPLSEDEWRRLVGTLLSFQDRAVQEFTTAMVETMARPELFSSAPPRRSPFIDDAAMADVQATVARALSMIQDDGTLDARLRSSPATRATHALASRALMIPCINELANGTRVDTFCPYPAALPPSAFDQAKSDIGFLSTVGSFALYVVSPALAALGVGSWFTSPSRRFDSMMEKWDKAKRSYQELLTLSGGDSLRHALEAERATITRLGMTRGMLDLETLECEELLSELRWYGRVFGGVKCWETHASVRITQANDQVAEFRRDVVSTSRAITARQVYADPQAHQYPPPPRGRGRAYGPPPPPPENPPRLSLDFRRSNDSFGQMFQP